VANRKLEFSLVALFDPKAALKGLRQLTDKAVAQGRKLVAKMVPSGTVMGMLGGIVTGGARILKGLVGVVGKVVGGMLSAFGKLLSGVVSIFGKIVGAGVSVLGKLPKVLLLAGGAAAAANAAFFALVNSVAKAGDEIAKMGIRTGLSIKFLSEMQHVLALGDAQMGSLQKAVRGVAMAVEGASAGQKEYQESFDRLGVSIYDTNGRIKGSEQLFVELCDALKRVRSVLLRAGLAQALFGRGAQELMPTIMATKGSIAEARKEAEAFGLTWSGPAAKAAVDFRDNLTRVQNALRGLRKQFLTPFLRPFSNSLARTSKWLASHREQVKAWGEKAANAFVEYSKKAKDAVIDLWGYLTGLDWKETFAGLDDRLKGIGESFLRLSNLFVEVTTEGLKAGPLGEAVLGALEWLEQQILKWFEDLGPKLRQKTINLAAQVVRGWGDVMQAMQDAAKVGMPGTGKFIKALGLEGATSEVAEYLAQTMEGYEAGLEFADKITGKSNRRLAQRQEEQAAILKRMSNAWLRAKDLMSEIAGEAAEQVGAVPVPKSGERIRAEQRAEAGRQPMAEKLARRSASLRGTEELLKQVGRAEEAAAVAARREEVDKRLIQFLDDAVNQFDAGAERDKRLGEQVSRLDRRLSRLDHARA